MTPRFSLRVPASSQRILSTLSLLGAAWLLSIPAARAQVLRQLFDLPSSLPFTPSVDDSGTAAYINSSTNQFGDNPNYSWQIFRFDPVTGSGQKVSSFVKGVEPS